MKALEFLKNIKEDTPCEWKELDEMHNVLVEVASFDD